MKFAPEIHTKEFLLQNHLVAVELAKNSPEFINSIAQDESYLIETAITAKEQRWKLNPLAVLADRLGWASSPAAQNKNILSLEIEGRRPVALLLVDHLPWASSPIAQDKDVLRLARSDGYSVAHGLSKHDEWGLTSAAQDLEVIRDIVFSSTGEAVAHFLAKRNLSWLSTHRAYDPEVLSLLSTRNPMTVFDYAFDSELTDNPRTKVNIMLRPLKFGDAINIKESKRLTATIARLFVDEALDYVSQAADEVTRTHLIAALYSSLINMKSAVPGIKSQDNQLAVMTELDCAIKHIEPMLLKLADKNADFTMLFSGRGKHCEPARVVVLKRMNSTVISALSDNVDEQHSPAQSPSPSIY